MICDWSQWKIRERLLRVSSFEGSRERYGKAINPGLVYDTEPVDYITYLCTIGFTRLIVFSYSKHGLYFI